MDEGYQRALGVADNCLVGMGLSGIDNVLGEDDHLDLIFDQPRSCSLA